MEKNIKLVHIFMQQYKNMDGKIYKNRIEAAKDVGLKDHRSITNALKESWRTAGKDQKTGIRYHWRYFSEIKE